MHINKVHHVTTISSVANSLGESEDWLSDVANEVLDPKAAPKVRAATPAPAVAPPAQESPAKKEAAKVRTATPTVRVAASVQQTPPRKEPAKVKTEEPVIAKPLPPIALQKPTQQARGGSGEAAQTAAPAPINKSVRGNISSKCASFE